MRRVSWRVRELQLAPHDDELLSPIERAKPIRGHGLHVAPQPVHVLTVQPASARQQLRRIDHVRRAARMDEHVDMRMTLEDRSCRPCMIEMDVREKDLADILKAHRFAFERRFQRLKRRRWPRVDQCDACRAVKDSRGNQLRATKKVQVDIVNTRGERRHAYILCPSEVRDQRVKIGT